MRLDYITSYGRASTRKESTIVGRKHSSVTLTCNERVYFRREKDNPHDINALLVLNMAGSKVGHVIASTAAELAPSLHEDRRITGYISTANPNKWRCTMVIDM